MPGADREPIDRRHVPHRPLDEIREHVSRCVEANVAGVGSRSAALDEGVKRGMLGPHAGGGPARIQSDDELCVRHRNR